LTATGGNANWAVYAAAGKSYFSQEVGIGTTSPSYMLDIVGSANVSWDIYAEHHAGIGTQSPEATLHVIDGGSNEIKLKLGDENQPDSEWNFAVDATAGFLLSNENGGTQNDVLFADPQTGEIGLGTTFPTHNLHINADVDQDVVRFQAAGLTKFNIDSEGGVNIGTAAAIASNNSLYVNDTLWVNTTSGAAGYNVAVDGKIMCEELKVQDSGSWPDYVFADEYDLPTLEEVEAHIEENNHLLGVPDACTVEKEGIMIGQMQKVMMEKIEELTLYMIDANKQIVELKNEVKELKNAK
jgi:hypothetical protein